MNEYTDYISSIEDVIEDARNGRMFILVDAEDRENEGDLVIPAQMATPAAVRWLSCEPLLDFISLEEAWHGESA